MSNTNLSSSKVYGEDSGSITVGKKIGEGQEGAVYRLENQPEYAIKIFSEFDNNEKEAKIRSMIRNAPVDPTYENKKERSIVWPIDSISDSSGRFLGYKMEYKDLSEYTNIRDYARSQLKWNSTKPYERYITALNFTLVIKAIHVQGHALGDLNHQNILIKDSIISLIDCDAFHIKGDKLYEGNTVFGRYTPPEGRGQSIGEVKTADRFGLAVHIFQLLMEAFHPYQADPKNSYVGKYEKMIIENDYPYINSTAENPHDLAPDYEQLHPKVKQLFKECFLHGENDPSRRPTADEWIDGFEEIVDVETESVAVNSSSDSTKNKPNQSKKTNSSTTKHSSSATNYSSDPEPVSADVAGGQNSPRISIPSAPVSLQNELKRMLTYLGLFALIVVLGILMTV
jgi:DNA-binding helix-hairpin-helix protein with protein kinase domain